MKKSRRIFLNRSALALAGVGLSAGLGVYSFQRGIRLPTLHWDPLKPETNYLIAQTTKTIVSDLIQTSNSENAYDACFRAFAPEPTLTLSSQKSKQLKLVINNIVSDAELRLDEQAKKFVDEKISGSRRELTINLNDAQVIKLRWKLDEQKTYRFASIGDTGGDQELEWCIKRAHALGARFLLHLGDFNYQAGDYQRAISLFNDSPLPIYVTIGNHDFHEDGAIYGQFLREIGPLNHCFSIAKTRFANIDTAANFLPYSAGQRGVLFDKMRQSSGFTDTVAFTHRPLHDPAPEQGTEHAMGSKGERDWLIRALKEVGAKSLLSGHIHIYDRSDFNGIDNIIAGQGLGHQDLIVGRDYSKMVIGDVDTDGKVSYSSADLAMPMGMHCHPRVDPVKNSLRTGAHQHLIETIDKACKDPT